MKKSEEQYSAETKSLRKAGYKMYACFRTSAEDLEANPFGSEIADREQVIDSRGRIWFKKTAEELATARNAFINAGFGSLVGA